MGMTVFSGMLIATILGVLLIPMLYVVVERVTGGSKAPVPKPPLPSPQPVAAGHGHGAH